MAFWKKGFLAFSRFILLLPLSWRMALGRVLGVLWFDVLRVRRRLVLENLSRACPNLSYRSRTQLGRQSLYHLGYGFIDLLTLPFMSPERVDRYVHFEGLENLRGGGFLLSLHMGPFDMVLASLALKKVPLVCVTKSVSVGSLHHFWFWLRSFHGVEFIAAHGKQTPFQILGALKAQKVVMFVLDQHMGKPYGVETKLFGYPAGTAKGLALFEKKASVPVWPLVCYRQEDYSLRIRVEQPLPTHLSPDLENEEFLRQRTQEYQNWIEAQILARPDQWLWVHRRFKPV